MRFFFSSRRRHTRLTCDWSSDVCSSDLNPKSMQIRFHTQTGGVTLQAQQPEVNIIRVALQGFAAVAGGKIGRASCRERVKILTVVVAVLKNDAHRQYPVP